MVYHIKNEEEGRSYLWLQLPLTNLHLPGCWLWLMYRHADLFGVWFCLLLLSPSPPINRVEQTVRASAKGKNENPKRVLNNTGAHTFFQSRTPERFSKCWAHTHTLTPSLSLSISPPGLHGGFAKYLPLRGCLATSLQNRSQHRGRAQWLLGVHCHPPGGPPF